MRAKWVLPFVAVSVLAIVVVTIATSPSDQSPNESVRIAVSQTPLSAPFYVAEEFGFFQQCGIETELIDVSGGKRAFQMLQDGEVDFSTSSDTVATYQVALRTNFNVLASFASSENDVKILSHLPSLKPITDRTSQLGYWSDSASEHLAHTYLQLKQFTDSVETVEGTPEQLMSGFLSGELDALSLWEPYIWSTIQQMSEPEGYYLLPTEGLMSLHFMLLSNANMASRSDLTEKLLASLSLAIQSIHVKPVEAKAILIKRLAVDSSFLDWAWDDYLFQMRNASDLRFTMFSNMRWLARKDVDFSAQLV